MQPIAEDQELTVNIGHEGIYHFRDIKYVIRMTRKLASNLPQCKDDIDWLQNSIESFLILNSRFYDDLAGNLVKEVRKCGSLPKNFDLKGILETHRRELSAQYDSTRKPNRNTAAHSSNYQRVGVIEFLNDVLPKPISYRQTQELENMAAVDDIVAMWQGDMRECANNIEAIFVEIVQKINNDGPQHESS